MKVDVRDCVKNDLDLIEEIERFSFDDPYPRELFRSFLENPRCMFRAAVSENRLVGYYVIIFNRLHMRRGIIGVIASIAVHPNFRRRGIGKSLLADLLKKAKKAGVVELKLQVSVTNEAAKAMYRQEGFAESRLIKNYYGLEKDAAEMILELK